MNAGTKDQFKKLTPLEAVELSKMLEEKWGVSAATHAAGAAHDPDAATASDGPLDAVVADLVDRYMDGLASPAEHLADIRRRLAAAA